MAHPWRVRAVVGVAVAVTIVLSILCGSRTERDPAPEAADVVKGRAPTTSAAGPGLTPAPSVRARGQAEPVSSSPVPTAESPTPLTSEEARARLSALLQERLRLETILAAGIEAFGAGRFVESAEAARRVSKAEPDNAKAIELERAALAASRNEIGGDAIAEQKRTFEAWMSSLRHAPRMEQLLLAWPSQEFWNRLTALRSQPVEPAPARSDAYVLSIVQRVLVTVTFENTPLLEAARMLEALTAVEIILDPSLRKRESTVVVRHLDARDMTLAAALDSVTADGDLVWRVDQGVVTISQRSTPTGTGGAVANLPTTFYDVGSLLSRTGGADPAAPAMGDGPGTFGSSEALIVAVKAEVDPSSWSDDARTSIRVVGKTLIVKASEQVHVALKAWLGRRGGDR